MTMATMRAASPHKLSPISQNLPHGRSFATPPATKRTHTFTPAQIKSTLKTQTEEGDKENETVDGPQSEFSGKRWVWLADPDTAFIKGYIMEEDDNAMLHVKCVDESVRVVRKDEVDKVNPPKFDKANDMAELTHLNEASVVYNLGSRYMSDLIYTYSGLFLVAVNPYCSLPLYGKESIAEFKNKSHENAVPHIYATADMAFRRMLEMHEDQSILVTGESGAGKTENTKRIIQYLAAVTTSKVPTGELGSFEQQILHANPILEAFGNSQTVRNNNSSRFGKFIKIGFNRLGQIAGAYIDWYLLEKSRVVTQSSLERNYHIFYQLLHGASADLKHQFLLDGKISDYAYVKHGNRSIPGVSDADEFQNLIAAFRIMGFSEHEQEDLLRVIAIILHIGNLGINEERSSGQAKLVDYAQAERLCHVMGVPVDAFVKGLLRPRVKAGRDWVDQSRTAAQVQFSLHALAKNLYERGFAFLVRRINDVLEQDNGSANFIGVLDIAGFEIFENNSFEQLCINYTNEKLQQFFNHHMFVLEQEEYARENIEWQFIDFGHDLQPTIDLIEKSNPIGIFSCLDEDCVMPRATDTSFTDKLHSLWGKKSDKYKPSLFHQGFRLTHYAAEVEYSTEGWLEKNKDPLNDNIVRLLSQSSETHIAALFSEDRAGEQDSVRRRKGLFRTVAQRHKEQLTSLMTQLNSTHPHFVRCILPNHEKQPRKMDNMLVLDQLRCNGVLEGIRIARTGFPNRLSFAEFRQRYEILVPGIRGYVDGQRACNIILDGLGLDGSAYRVGITKVFFRAGVLAELEERREKLVREVVTSIQSRARGFLQRRVASKRLYRSEAVQVIAQNLKAAQTRDAWWKMYIKMQPLLLAQRETVQSLARDGEYRKIVSELSEAERECEKAQDRARRAEAEAKRFAETLESERALALDKEEILRRSQARESDLEEQLAGALEDLDKLEGQCEELLDSKRKADEEVKEWRAELEKGARIIGRLEGEKGELEKRLAFVEGELLERDGKYSVVEVELSQLHQEVRLLKSIISQREKQLMDVEERLKQSDSEVESRLKQARMRFDHKISVAVQENRELRDQITGVRESNGKLEGVIKKKEADITVLLAEQQASRAGRERLEGEKAVLEKQVLEIKEKMSAARGETDSLRARVGEVEKDREALQMRLKTKEEAEGENKKRRVVVSRETMKDMRTRVQEAESSLRAVLEAMEQAARD